MKYAIKRSDGYYVGYYFVAGIRAKVISKHLMCVYNSVVETDEDVNESRKCFPYFQFSVVPIALIDNEWIELSPEQEKHNLLLKGNSL